MLSDMIGNQIIWISVSSGAISTLFSFVYMH